MMALRLREEKAGVSAELARRVHGDRSAATLRVAAWASACGRVGHDVISIRRAPPAASIAVGELHIAFSYVPLVLHRLTFRALEGGSVDATLEMRIDFEDENAETSRASLRRRLL